MAIGNKTSNKFLDTSEQEIKSGISNKTSHVQNASNAAGYLGGDLGLGAFGMVEGTWDLAMGALGALSGDKSYARYTMQHDVTGGLTQKLNNDMNPGKVMQYGGEVAQGMGQSSIFLLGNAGKVLFFTGAMGRATAEAMNTTGKLGGKEYFYGFMDAVKEEALEILSGQTFTGMNKTGKSITKGIQSLMGKASKEAATAATRTGILKTMISEGASEFFEEFLGSYIETFNKKTILDDKEAEYSFTDALYSGLVGFGSGSLMSGVHSSARAAFSHARGSKAINEGNVDTILNRAKIIQDYFKTEDWSKYANDEGIAGAYHQLVAAYQAYEKLAETERTSDKAKVYIGEMEAISSMLETMDVVGRESQVIKDKADYYADYASKLFNEKFTKEDILSNKNDVTMRLALMRFVGYFDNAETVASTKYKWIKDTIAKNSQKTAQSSSEAFEARTTNNTEEASQSADGGSAYVMNGITESGIEFSENGLYGTTERVYDIGNNRSVIAIQNTADDGSKTWHVSIGENEELQNEGEYIDSSATVPDADLDKYVTELKNNYEGINEVAKQRKESGAKAKEEKAEKKSKKSVKTEEKAKTETKKETKKETKTEGKKTAVRYASKEELEKAKIVGEGYRALGTASLNLNQKAMALLLNKMFADTKYTVLLYSGKGTGKTGAHMGNTIYVDVNAKMLSIASHELVHSFSAKSPAQYKALQDFVIKTQFGGDKAKLDAAVAEMQASYEKAESHLSYDEAVEEITAKSCENILGSAAIIKEMFKSNKKLFKAMEAFVDGFVHVLDLAIAQYSGTTNKYAAKMAEHVEDVKKARKLFYDAYNSSLENQSARNVEEEKIFNSIEEDTEYGVGEVTRTDSGKLVTVESNDGSEVAFSYETYEEYGRRRLATILHDQGYTREEVEAAMRPLEASVKYIKELASKYSAEGYTALEEHFYASVERDYRGHQILHSLVKNGDYPVNIDLSTICKKRVAYMKLLVRLMDSGIFQNVSYDSEAIAKVNGILRKYGFETACLGCFVESRRLRIQAWAEGFAAKWNEQVEKVNPNAKYFTWATKKNNTELTEDEIVKIETELRNTKKNKKGNINLGQGSVEAKIGKLLELAPDLAQKIDASALLNPAGLEAMRGYPGGSNVFALLLQNYGAATPKIVQEYNAYNSEIADLTFKFAEKTTGQAVTGAGEYTKAAQKANADTKPKKPTGKNATAEATAAYKEAKAKWDAKCEEEAVRNYLYDVGGVRIQSFSDFMIENVFDYYQMMADLAARKLPMHGYSKEITALRLFGMSGTKWNGSLIATIMRNIYANDEEAKKYAGLIPADVYEKQKVNGKIPEGLECMKVTGRDGKTYYIGFDDFARNAATKGKTFIQSIGLKDIMALVLDKRYSKHCGNITIGVSDEQIIAMLRSPYFRMVIPYHASGMLPEFAALVGVDAYNDYSAFQETKVERYYDLDGNIVASRAGTGYENAKHESVSLTKEQSAVNTHFNFNNAVNRLGSAKAAADEYIAWCKDRSQHPITDSKGNVLGYAELAPKFSNSPYGYDFTKEENYYKLLEDFNEYDLIDELDGKKTAALQDNVRMILPGQEKTKLTEAEIEEYKQRLRDVGIFTEKDIKKYAERANWTDEQIIDHELGGRAEYKKATDGQFEAMFREVSGMLETRKREGSAISYKDYVTTNQAAKEARKNGLDSKGVNPPKGTYKISAEDAVKLSYEEIDDDYMKAVREGNMEAANALVKAAAAKAGYNTPKLFHGTRWFGWTKYVDRVNEVPFIYTSTDSGVSANYAGDNHYAGVRNINQKYIGGDDLQSIIKDAKSVYDIELKKATVEDKKAIFERDRAKAFELSEEREKIVDNIPQNMPDEVYAAIDRIESLMWTAATDSTYEEATGESWYHIDTDLLQRIAEYDANREVIREYFGENQKNLTKEQKEALRFYFGYDFGDFVIDLEYGMARAAGSAELLINEKGGLVDPAKLREDMDASHNIGAYQLYGNLGNNPLIFDANGATFTDVIVPQIGDGKRHSTDYISKWALDNGYTSVIMKNIYDYGNKADNYVFFSSSQIKSADDVTYDDEGHVIPLSERFNESDEDIRYSYEDSGTKPRSAKDQRDQGYMLSSAKFYSLYSVHKLDIGKRFGDINEQIDSIKSKGFVSSTNNANVMPTSTFASIQTDKNGKPMYDNVVQARYALKKGEKVLLVPKEFVSKDDIIKNGFKPFDYEIAEVEYDNQPPYEIYKKAYEQLNPKYSFEELDDQYMDAYFDGDDDLMQEIIDKAANAAGYKYKAYHHTENGFTRFDLSKARKNMDIQGFFFSADPEAESEYGSVRYDTYLKMENPYIIDSKEKANAIPVKFGTENYGVKVRQWLLDNGYDSVIRKAEYYGAEADEYVVLNPEQIKSAEPVTYTSFDDYGEAIPPSQRFDQTTDDIRYSFENIIGDDGTNYGQGVKLDSDLLDGLTEDQRKTKVKDFIDSIGGYTLVAYDKNGHAVNISIAKKDEKFKNSKNRITKVNNDLKTKFENNEVRQESIVLINELAEAGKRDVAKASTKSHGWLDNNGKNDWDYWNCYVEDKIGDIYKVTLNVANADDGRKLLYDIKVSKKVGQTVKVSVTSTTNANSISQKQSDVNKNILNVDSDGNELSEGQRDFFEESKAIDDDGRLLALYHGTMSGNNFTKFNPKAGLNINGMFFTNKKSVASHFARNSNVKYFNKAELDNAVDNLNTEKELIDFAQSKVGATIKVERRDFGGRLFVGVDITDSSGFSAWHPLGDASDAAGSRVDVENDLRYRGQNISVTDYLKNEIKSMISDSQYAYVYKCYLNIKNPLIVDCKKRDAQDFVFEGKDHYSAEAVAEVAKERGHDGVILKNVLETSYYDQLCDDYIVFESNQIKLTSNLNPTADDDIQYSLDNDSYTAKEMDEARKIVDDFDAYGWDTKQSVLEFLRSAQGTKADKATISAISSIIAASEDLDVRFVDAAEKGSIHRSEIGETLILLDKNLESAQAIRRTLSAEIIHLAENTETYGTFAKLVLGAASKEEQDAVVEKYTKYWKDRGIEVSKEALLKECVSELGADMITDADLVSQWGKKKKSIPVRLAAAARDLARKLFGKNREAYKEASKLSTLLASAVAENSIRKAAGAPGVQWSLSNKGNESKTRKEILDEARELHYFTRPRSKEKLQTIIKTYLAPFFDSSSPANLAKAPVRDFSIKSDLTLPESAAVKVKGMEKLTESLYQAYYNTASPRAARKAAESLARQILDNSYIDGSDIALRDAMAARGRDLAGITERAIAENLYESIDGGEAYSHLEDIKSKYDRLLDKVRRENNRREQELRDDIAKAKGIMKDTLQALEQIRRAVNQTKAPSKFRGILASPQMETLTKVISSARSRGGFLINENVRGSIQAYVDFFANQDNQRGMAEEAELMGIKKEAARETYEACLEAIKNFPVSGENAMGETLTDAEIETFTDVARTVAQLYRTYNKFYDEQRKEWIDADTVSKRGIDNTKKMKQLHEGDKKLVKAFRQLWDRYGIEALDPLAVGKLLDGYNENGVMYEMMYDIVNAENAKELRIQKYMKPVDDFIAEHKGFEKHLTSEEDKIEYRGQKLTRDEFIQLYMTTFRKQALYHLTFGRMEFGTREGRDGLRIIDPALQVDKDWSSYMKEEGLTIEDFETEGEKILLEIRQLGDKVLTAEDKQYIALMENFYNKVSTKDKKDMDMKYFGMTNVIEDENDKYVPIVTSMSSRASSVTDERGAMSSFTTLSGQSFNKNTIKGAKNPMSFTGAYNLMKTHANGLAAYVELYSSMQKLDRVWSTDINHNPQNSSRLRDALSDTYGDNVEKYVRSLMGDIQGINTKKPNAWNPVIGRMRSNYAIFQLGANPKTWFNQLGSMGALVRFADVDSIMKGLRAPNADKMAEYSEAAAIRSEGDVAVKAQALTEQVSGKLKDLLMKPIGWSDMKIVGMSWGACQYQIEKTKGYAVGTEENLREAGKLLNKVINESQDTSLASTKTGIARADSELIKGLAMFRSAPFKQFSRISDAVGTLATLNARKKAGENISEEQLKTAQNELARTTAGWTAQAAIGIAITALFDWLYKKDDDKKAKDYVIDFISELISVIPIVGDIYSYFADGYDVSYFAYDMLNDAMDNMKDTVSLIAKGVSGQKITRQQIAKTAYNNAVSIGEFSGIPVRNVKNFFQGITKRISSVFGGSLGYSLDAGMYEPSYNKDLTEALESGNERLAEKVVELLYADKKSTSKLSEKAMSEVLRLYKAGNTKVLPPTIGNTITVDGVEYEIKAKDQKQIRQICAPADEAVVGLIASDIYKSLSDEEKATAIGATYATYYDKALNYVFGVPMTKRDALSYLGDMGTILAAAAHINAIQSDKDENGKTVNGSRKAKVEKYLGSLDIDLETAELILYAAGYSSDTLMQHIADIAAQKNLSDKQYTAVAQALGIAE